MIMKINNILVDMDPTKEEQPALNRAVELAKLHDASIELFLADYHRELAANWLWNETQMEKVKKAFLKTKRRWLETYVSAVVKEGLSVSVDVRWHKPLYEGIIIKAKESKADIVIKSTHRHPLVNKVFFTPNDWQLLKRCPVPVLFAKERTHTNYRQIMAAVDPSRVHDKPETLDKSILNAASSLAEKLSAERHVVHCFEPVGIELWRDLGVGAQGLEVEAFDHVEYVNRLEKHHRDEFESLIKDYQFSNECKHLEQGTARKLLPKIVDENNIDLLVVGIMSRSGILGGTAEKILDKVNCDILAIKP